jgi:chromate transporter
VTYAAYQRNTRPAFAFLGVSAACAGIGLSRVRSPRGTHHWLSAGQMLDGLGLAETTPGSLDHGTQFVGFLGGWNHPGQLPPLLAATVAALVTTWTTFTPCFLWIFLGGPYIERLRGN